LRRRIGCKAAGELFKRRIKDGAVFRRISSVGEKPNSSAEARNTRVIKLSIVCT